MPCSLVFENGRYEPANNLSIGGYPTPLAGRNAFDAVVLCSPRHQPPDEDFPDCTLIRCPFEDEEDGLTPEVLARIDAVAEEVAAMLGQGKKVAVTCAMGRNRSALVAARVLMKRGWTAKRAFDQIRTLRPTALRNEAFVRHLLGGPEHPGWPTI